MTFSKQPVAWLTAIAALLMLVVDVISKSVDIGTAVNSAIVVLSGVITWNKVTPISKFVEEINTDEAR